MNGFGLTGARDCLLEDVSSEKLFTAIHKASGRHNPVGAL
jgi:hypothetical protein